ncbi:hypothetical protein E4T43_04772 [Aureobasidium subglaciale]|nr:hypothetical protein E4T43_04772 [Aureobasidium subglaciale]
MHTIINQMANFAGPRMWLSITTPDPTLDTLGWEETVHSPPDRMECESRDLIVSAKHLVKPQETSGDWLDGFESQIGDEFSDHESDDGKAVASQDERIDVTTHGLTDVNDTHNQETAFMMKKKSTEGS